MALGVLLSTPRAIFDMSSYDPDDHFKLSKTSVGHSKPEL